MKIKSGKKRKFISLFIFILISFGMLSPRVANAQTCDISTGDLDCSGSVDIADFGIFVTEFVKVKKGDIQPNSAKSDFNKDGSIDLADFEIFRKYFIAGKSHHTTPITTTSSTPTTILTVTPSSGQTSQPGTLSMAMGKWTPSKWDTCTQVEHDSYSVIGPDGKKYPTWHPSVYKRADGTTCTFGHDHGRDPSGYAYWNDLRKHFAYDADKNGIISNTELSTAGIPFGYVNEQIDGYFAGKNTTTAFMRHEDHVGHKVEYANGEGDIGEGTDPFDSNKTGGLVVPVKSKTAGKKWDASGIRCYHFNKVHQGVSTPDAFTNNLHEVIFHSKCTSTLSAYAPSSSIVSGMVAFGATGEFTRFCPDNRTEIITTGKTDVNKNFPGQTGKGTRNIITRDCVEQTVLVPQGQFSGFPYEEWDGGITVKTAAGKEIASVGGSWEVLDAIRYYNPASANKLSYTADWCYETLGTRQARGGTCDAMTNYRDPSKPKITFDSPQSFYKGLHRGQYVNAPVITNATGQEYWYTDPFGGNASATPFAGSIRQQITKVNASLAGLQTDPRIIQRMNDSGGNTVHAPN